VLFVAVTGVIYLGIATPTEASALGAFGALCIAAWNRKLTSATLMRALMASASTTCMIFLIIMGAQVFGYFVTLTQVTQSLILGVKDLGLPPTAVLVLVLALYFILGCIMDQAAILILTVPILLPLMMSLGFDPVWFGVVVIVMAEIGLVTPPLGLNVFVVSKYTGKPLEDVFAGVWPHILAHLVAVALLCIFPQIVTWLPSHMH
jgi:tripartite ATP-independent transporter DctM subunit